MDFKEIHMATTFGKAEVEAMLMELSRCMGNHLREGERVRCVVIHKLFKSLSAWKLMDFSFTLSARVVSECMGSRNINRIPPLFQKKKLTGNSRNILQRILS